VGVADRRHSDDEREALAVAFVDLRIRPARRVVELAAAGKLRLDGRPLQPFEANQSTVRSLAWSYGRRRAGSRALSWWRRRRATRSRRCAGGW
jgi:hypothetical protein